MEKLLSKIEESFLENQRQMFEIFKVKHAHYGAANICAGDSRDEIEEALFSIQVRMQDKLSRLKTLIRNKDFDGTADESMADTLLDLANYAVIAKVVLEGKWKGE